MTDRPFEVSIAAAFLFVIVCGALHLAGTPLINPDEGRYLEVAREMIATGDYIVPRIDGYEHWTKPPGAYWAIAGFLRMFDLAPWAARLPAFLAGLIVAGCLFLLTRRFAGRQAAVFAMFVHATMLEPFALYRFATPDSLQGACIAVALTAGFFARESSDDGAHGRARGLRLLAYVALGVSFVVKGPIALLVYAAVWIADHLPAGRRRLDTHALRSGLVRAAACLGVIAVIGLPWFLKVASLRPELVDYYLKNEVAGRYFTDQHNRTQPFWFFLPVVFVGLMPWAFVAIHALVAAVRSRGPFAGAEARDRSRIRFLAAWFFGTLVLFSIGRSKLVTYVLPLFPPVAALIGIAAVRMTEGRADSVGTGSPLPAPGRSASALWSRSYRSVYVLTGLIGTTLAVILGVRHEVGAGGIAFGVGSLALGIVAAMTLGRRERALRVVTVALCVAAMLHTCARLAGEHDTALGIKGDLAWFEGVFAAERFVPTGEPIDVSAPSSRTGPAGCAATLAFYGAAVHTLELRLLHDKPAYFPHLVADEEREIEARAKGEIDVKEFLRTSGPGRPVYIGTRGHLVAELEQKAGTRLVEVARRGVDRNAVVILRTP